MVLPSSSLKNPIVLAVKLEAVDSRQRVRADVSAAIVDERQIDLVHAFY